MGQGSLNDSAYRKRLPSWKDISRGNHPRSIYCIADCVVTKILVKEGQQVKKGQTLLWFEEKINEVQVSDAELSDSTSSKKRKVTHTEKRQMYLPARANYVVAKIYVTENQEVKKWQPFLHVDFLESEPNSLTLLDDIEEVVFVCPSSDYGIWYPAIKEEVTKPTQKSLISQDVVSDVDMMNQGSLSDAVDKQQQQKPLCNWNDISHYNVPFTVFALADCVVTKILVKEGQVVKEGEVVMYLEFEAMKIKEEDSKAISPSSTQSDSKDVTPTSQVINRSFSQSPTISKSYESKVIHTGKIQHAITARDSYVVSKLNVSEKQEVKKCKPLFHYELTEMNPCLALPIGIDVESILAIPLSDTIWTAGICDANFMAK